jgi:hypothetical protein
VIGVHAPEFEFERERANVQSAVRDLNVAYPGAIDSNHRIWDAFNNISADGVEAPPSGDEQSPETYVGYRQAQRFAPERAALDSRKTYRPPMTPSLNEWGAGGS